MAQIVRFYPRNFIIFLDVLLLSQIYIYHYWAKFSNFLTYFQANHVLTILPFFYQICNFCYWIFLTYFKLTFWRKLNIFKIYIYHYWTKFCNFYTSLCIFEPNLPFFKLNCQFSSQIGIFCNPIVTTKQLVTLFIYLFHGITQIQGDLV